MWQIAHMMVRASYPANELIFHRYIKGVDLNHVCSRWGYRDKFYTYFETVEQDEPRHGSGILPKTDNNNNMSEPDN